MPRAHSARGQLGFGRWGTPPPKASRDESRLGYCVNCRRRGYHWEWTRTPLPWEPPALGYRAAQLAASRGFVAWGLLRAVHLKLLVRLGSPAHLPPAHRLSGWGCGSDQTGHRGEARRPMSLPATGGVAPRRTNGVDPPR